MDVEEWVIVREYTIFEKVFEESVASKKIIYLTWQQKKQNE